MRRLRDMLNAQLTDVELQGAVDIALKYTRAGSPEALAALCRIDREAELAAAQVALMRQRLDANLPGLQAADTQAAIRLKEQTLRLTQAATITEEVFRDFALSVVDAALAWITKTPEEEIRSVLERGLWQEWRLQQGDECARIIRTAMIRAVERAGIAPAEDEEEAG